MPFVFRTWLDGWNRGSHFGRSVGTDGVGKDVFMARAHAGIEAVLRRGASIRVAYADPGDDDVIIGFACVESLPAGMSIHGADYVIHWIYRRRSFKVAGLPGLLLHDAPDNAIVTAKTDSVTMQLATGSRGMIYDPWLGPMAGVAP
jgi:hypothetical protein